MMLTIPAVLSADQVAAFRRTLDAAPWIDGAVTAGHQSAKAKDNLQIPEGRSTDHLPAGKKPWRDIWSGGQGIGLIHDIPTVAELVHRLQQEYVVACAIPDMAEAARAAL